jgi:hypothetical protein
MVVDDCRKGLRGSKNWFGILPKSPANLHRAKVKKKEGEILNLVICPSSLHGGPTGITLLMKLSFSPNTEQHRLVF